MWVFKGVIFLALLFTLVYFFVTNSSQTVDINLFGRQFLDISIYWIVVITFLLGFATAFVLGAIREFRFHREIGHLKRSAVEKDREIGELREAFWQDLRVTGSAYELNKNLEMANRLADYLELGELMARDALQRKESCGGHFREEYVSPEGEAARNDDDFMYVAAWEWQGEGKEHKLHKEQLEYESIEVKTRSYK